MRSPKVMHPGTVNKIFFTWPYLLFNVAFHDKFQVENMRLNICNTSQLSKGKYFRQKFQFFSLLKPRYANFFPVFSQSTDETLHDIFQTARSAGNFPPFTQNWAKQSHRWREAPEIFQ